MWVGVFIVIILLLFFLLLPQTSHSEQIEDKMGASQSCGPDTMDSGARASDLEYE